MTVGLHIQHAARARAQQASQVTGIPVSRSGRPAAYSPLTLRQDAQRPRVGGGLRHREPSGRSGHVKDQAQPGHGSRAAVTAADFPSRLAAVGAQFAYLLDPDGLEGRHWTNDGRTEDIATGSAAGTVGAYLARVGRVALNRPFTLHQGRFTGRPSQIQVEPRGSAGDIARVLVGGQVALVAKGTVRNPPRAPAGSS